jgi:hypothetical protein
LHKNFPKSFYFVILYVQPLNLTRRECKGKIYFKNIRKNSCKIRIQLKSRIWIRKKSFRISKLIRWLFFVKVKSRYWVVESSLTVDRNILNLHMGWSIFCSSLISGFFSATVPFTFFFGIDRWYPSLIRSIRKILVRIRFIGSVPLTNGSGSGSCSFRQWPLRHQQKIIFFSKVFMLIPFWRYIYIILQKDKKS